jgi:hypothetical protein
MPKHDDSGLEPEARDFYCHTLGVFERAGISYLVGGAYAFARFTGIDRHTKDFDVFVREQDFARSLEALAAAGFNTEVPFPHWLGKAFHPRGEYFIDVIYASGNGVARVDDEWFTNALPDRVFECPVLLCPAEEIIWTKAFVQERERYDGADVAHLLRACGPDLDWARLFRRFGEDWPVLLAHAVLFTYIYPSERERLPSWVMQDLLRRLETELSAPTPSDRVCRGTVLSRQQYLIDVQRWGYRDVRELPQNAMSEADIANWTAAIANDGSPEG